MTEAPRTSAASPRAFRLLDRIIDVRPAELAALGYAWLYILAVLSSYYILRPIRDQAGIAGGVNNLQWLFTATLLGMLVLNVPYGWLVRTLPRSRFIPITYRFFGANLLMFAVALHWSGPDSAVWIGRIFFVWTSIFNLFVVSVFWAMIVDLFDSEQGKRLFGFIAAGATVGAIMGSAVTASLAQHVAELWLLVGAALLLEVAVFCVGRLSRLSHSLNQRPGPDNTNEVVGGGVLTGITHAFKSPYLVNVSLFLLLFAITSTFLYFEQASIVSRTLHGRSEQTAFFAKVDLAVNVLTLGVQLFLTGRIVRRLGIAIALALLPGFSVLGFGAVAAAPALSSVVPFQVLRRAGNFAIARPTREVLFTVLPREDRYKAKSFIDTVIYRLGDQVGAWAFALLGALGWGSRASLVAVPLSAAWLANAIWLGRRQEEMARRQGTEAAAVEHR
ncbi:MAG: MFS transporter [Acetobacteraceae bacterium]|nr:MFS transporter [Acetobacteraceae bacterium]